MPRELPALVADLTAMIAAAELGPADQVRALAALLSAVGWGLAQPGQAGDRGALEAALARQGDLACALILQGAVLEEWVGGPAARGGGAAPIDNGGARLR